MMDGVVSLLSLLAFEYFCYGIIEKRGEGLISGAMPFYNCYQTKDGEYITIGCIEPHFWENICRALGREDLIPHQYAEGEKREEIFSYFRDVFRTKTRDEWFDLLKEKNIPIGKVYSIDEVFTDPQILHRHMVEEIEHPTLGKVKQVGVAMKFSDTPGGIRSLSPLLGEHTEEILQDLGYTKEQIEQLRKAGAII
jgi:crotonobetainyl-CoA:carnitine CoA-transferase CaiB-like acyl-CoA transferase